MYCSGFSLYLFIAFLPISSLPVVVSLIGQGVLANIIDLNTVGSWHNTDIADTCNPSPPTCCGNPSSLAFLRLLQCSSCSMTPLDIPTMLSDIPLLLEIKQESLPPDPITVGAIADITGAGLPAPVAL